MGKLIWFINGFMGTLFGLGVIIGPGIYGIIELGINEASIAWIISGIISLSFAIYQWIKFFKK